MEKSKGSAWYLDILVIKSKLRFLPCLATLLRPEDFYLRQKPGIYKSKIIARDQATLIEQSIINSSIFIKILNIDNFPGAD